MNKKIIYFLSFLFICILVQSSFALADDKYDLIIVNSYDWIDVYNSLLYGSLSNTEVIFLSDQSQTSSFFNTMDYSVKSILLVESDSRLSPTVAKILDTLEYEVELLTQEDTSLFFSSLANVDSYILADKDFPLNGLSVAPYAVASNSWVFFVDNQYNSKIIDIVKGKQILSYGRIPQQLLYELTPSIVIDEGNKYRNGVAISKLFLESFPTKQYVLTEGGFLESEFFIGSFPVLVVGISATPKPVEDFFVESDVQSAVVVGQASIPPSMNLKKLLESNHNRELKLVAKLGRTSSDPAQKNDILPLNIFPIPSPSIVLSIDSFFYNQITRQLEVRFSNNGDIFLSYVPGVILTQNGQKIIIDSLDDAYFLEKSESRTIQFPVELNPSDTISAQMTVIYGESSDSFDLSLVKEFSPLEFISIVDNSDLLIQKIEYDSKNKVFLISIHNDGSVDAYADIDLTDVFVNGESGSFSSPRAILIEPGQTSILVIYAVLSDIDLIANPVISYDLFFGQRNFALIKKISDDIVLREYSSFNSLIAGSGMIILLVSLFFFALLLFFILRKKRIYVCLRCGTRHNRKPIRCSSCAFGRFKKE